MRFRILSRRLAAVAALALPLAASACQTPSGADSGDVHALLNARKHWLEQGVRSYTLVAAPRCFCGGLGEIRTTVVNGAVTERVYVESGDPVPDAWYTQIATVDAMLETVDGAFRKDAADVRVTYSSRGIPTDAYIDYKANWADEEFGWSVVSFTPAP
jgi:hypothetical protein